MKHHMIQLTGYAALENKVEIKITRNIWPRGKYRLLILLGQMRGFARGLKWKGLYPIAPFRGPKQRLHFLQSHSASCANFLNSKPRDKATISLKVLNRGGSETAAIQKPVMAMKVPSILQSYYQHNSFGSCLPFWTIYLEETQTHTACFLRRLRLLIRVFIHRFHPNSFLSEKDFTPTLSFFTSNLTPNPKRAAAHGEVRM